MFQLVHNPVMQRLFHDCPLLRGGDRRCWSRTWLWLSLGHSGHRVLFNSCRSILGRRRWGFWVLLLYVLEPNTWAVQRAGEQDGAGAAAEARVAVAGGPEWDWGQGVAGGVYVEIGFGGQRRAVPLGQQIASPVDSNKKNWLVITYYSIKEGSYTKKVMWDEPATWSTMHLTFIYKQLSLSYENAFICYATVIRLPWICIHENNIWVLLIKSHIHILHFTYWDFNSQIQFSVVLSMVGQNIIRDVIWAQITFDQVFPPYIHKPIPIKHDWLCLVLSLLSID